MSFGTRDLTSCGTQLAMCWAPGMTVTKTRQGDGWREVVAKPGKPPGPPHEGARMLCRGTSEPRELGAPHWRSGEQQVGVAGGPAQALG